MLFSGPLQLMKRDMLIQRDDIQKYAHSLKLKTCLRFGWCAFVSTMSVETNTEPDDKSEHTIDRSKAMTKTDDAKIQFGPL